MARQRPQLEFGGAFLQGKRRSKRPLNIKTPLHLVLRSELASGDRNLTKHRNHIEKTIKKASRRFKIKVYEIGLVHNHIHLCVRGYQRRDIQNFFRVVAGHIAQNILSLHPLNLKEKRFGYRCSSRNKFWQSRIYSRIVSWGQDFLNVRNYVIRNALEGLGLIPVKARNYIFSFNSA